MENSEVNVASSRMTATNPVVSAMPNQPSAKADQDTGDDADNESNQQSKLFQCYILLFFIFSLSQR